MKKFTFLLISFCYSLSVFAIEPIAEQDFSKDFKKLSKVEAMVNANPDLSVDSLIKEQPQLMKDLGIDNEAKSNIGKDDDPMRPAGFPAFWWGFCLGVWGILIVYLITDNDKAALSKTVKGCITATAIYVGITGLFYIVAVIAATTASPY
jgi:hypothetical protein